MSWILSHLELVVFAVIAISFIRRIYGFWKKMESETERRARNRPLADHDPDEVRRVQEIQDEIRRKIAQRRGGMPASAGFPPEATREEPPLVRPSRTPPTDTFGGPARGMREVFGELERRFQTPPDQVEATRQAERAQINRQEELAEQMRALEESRVVANRRAEQVRANLRADSQSERRLLAASRETLLGDLKNPASLRRAFVLREVLSAPVGLR